MVFPRQLECQRTLYSIQPRGIPVPTLYQDSSSSEVSWDCASRPVIWPICPCPWLARPAKHQLVSSGVKALLRALHVVRHVPSQFAFTPKLTLTEEVTRKCANAPVVNSTPTTRGTQSDTERQSMWSLDDQYLRFPIRTSFAIW